MRDRSLDLTPLQRQIESWPAAGAAASAATESKSTSEPASGRLVIYRSISEVDRTQWDEVAGSDAAPRSHAYLSAIEAAGVNDCQFFYPVIYGPANQILAHACVYTITTDFAQMLPRPLRVVANGLRRLWPNLLQVVITECASPLVAGHSISIRPGEVRRPLIRQLGDALATIARGARSRLLVIRDFLDADREDFDVLLDDGFNLTSNMPLARIRIRWASYEDYLDSMRSRYRKDLKRRLERVERGGQRALRLTEFADRSPLWAEQVAVMYERSRGFKRERVGQRYYEQMNEQLGEHCLLLAAERDGRTVAHGMVLFDEANTIATYFGRDAGPPGNEWFHLLNEVIRLAIERRSRYICLGLGSYDAKSLVGADIEPLHVYCRSTLAPVNWLMRRVPHTMAAQGARSRRIFRDEPEGSEDAP